MLLFTFLRKNIKKKVIVFFSSCNSVKYHAELLNYIDVPVLDLHVSSLTFDLSSPAPSSVTLSTFSLPKQRTSDTDTRVGQAKTTKTNKHIFRILQRPKRHLALHRRSSPRSRHSQSRLDHPIRPTRRSTRLHPSSRPDRTCWQSRQESVVLVAF